MRVELERPANSAYLARLRGEVEIRDNCGSANLEIPGSMLPIAPE
jgi:hypothetical protein